ncbi:hypothetical protein B484DRAFT_425602 [Ochromonadaceae sp. CCMP2298]|nr:hypothetical protein B484DRAFT_425602 [Ochromonadaceae sp. CCMP2298]
MGAGTGTRGSTGGGVGGTEVGLALRLKLSALRRGLMKLAGPSADRRRSLRRSSINNTTNNNTNNSGQGQRGQALRQGSESPATAAEHDVVVWLGDLNYRMVAGVDKDQVYPIIDRGDSAGKLEGGREGR